MAQSGQFRTVTEVRAGLVVEGYRDVNGQLSGASLLAQLGRLLTQAYAAPDPAPAEGICDDPTHRQRD
jgi:hypothetical protein